MFVALADGERVYALDAETGRLIWRSGNTEAREFLACRAAQADCEYDRPDVRHSRLNLETGSYREGG